MSTIPTINEQDIRDLVGERSFSLGRQYVQGKTIFNARRQGKALKARCQGSSPDAYRVEVTFDATGVTDAICSCPLGGHCKHIAALLLTWVHNPEEFLEQVEVDTVLEKCSKAELITLIKKMLKRQPDFELFLPTVGRQQASVDVEQYRRQVTNAFRGGYGRWGHESRVEDELLAVKETADDYLQQQDFTSAVSIYNAIITAVIENYDQYEDEDGELGSVINECVDELDKCLASVQNDDALREEIMGILFNAYALDVEHGGIGIGEEAPDIILRHATAEERQIVADWIREELSSEKKDGYSTGWRRGSYSGFLLDLEADSMDDEAYLRFCREMGRTFDLIDRLLKLGRIDEATGEAAQVSDYSLIGIADLFAQYGQDSLAEQMVQKRSIKSTDTRLLEWLKKRYLVRNDHASALKLAEELFHTRPGLAGYIEIRQLANQLGRWETLRQELLTFLEKSQNTSLLIEIALDEGEIDKALELVKPVKKPDQRYGYSYYSYPSLEIQVAKASEASRPLAAIQIYQKHVETLINQRGRGSYQTACGYLTTIRTLYEKLGSNDVWNGYITNLRDQNRNLRALKEELTNAGL